MTDLTIKIRWGDGFWGCVAALESEGGVVRSSELDVLKLAGGMARSIHHGAPLNDGLQTNRHYAKVVLNAGTITLRRIQRAAHNIVWGQKIWIAPVAPALWRAEQAGIGAENRIW